MGGVLSLLILALLVSCSQPYEVVDHVEGTLAAEEASHYTLEVRGVLVVALLTDEGDADLYISRITPEPNYLNYQYCSSSCGLDLVVVPTSKGVESNKVYINVLGHSRHQKSHYSLLIISPSSNDIDKYQVWERDPETGRQMLIVEYDPLQIANDPSLHLLIEELSPSENGVKDRSIGGPAWRGVKYIIECLVFLLLEIISNILI